MELLQDYDCTILYHPRRANVANALSMKSMGSLTFIVEVRRSIVMEFQELVDGVVKFEVTSVEFTVSSSSSLFYLGG